MTDSCVVRRMMLHSNTILGNYIGFQTQLWNVRSNIRDIHPSATPSATANM